MPEGAWAFDESVADVFDDMLARSIPQYDVMRSMVSDLAARGLRPGDSILDMGCSRGEALARVLGHPLCPPDVLATALEISEPMLEAAKARFADDLRVAVRQHDLREGLPVREGGYGVILAVLTVLFVPIQYRLALLRQAHQALRPGGRLLFVEKVLGSTADLDAELVDIYYDLKARNGYSQDQIHRKRMALEGVQIPVTAAWNEDTLARAGFTEYDCVWRWGNFAGWVAIR